MAVWKKANSKAQWFQNRYPGDPIDMNVVVMHTTEGGSWPSYSGGASAPHLTGMPYRRKVGNRQLLKRRKRVWDMKWRQHFNTNRSARALQNDAGGVETNTMHAGQIELIGTCDKATAKKYGIVYWKEAPDTLLREVGAALRWLHNAEKDFPLVDGAGKHGKPWTDAPGTYGENAPQRLSFAEWRNTYGTVGHQHVPENSHWDPGNFPIDRVLKFARGEKNDGPGKNEPKKPTRVQKARRLLWEAQKYAKKKGMDRRKKRINKSRRNLPKR